ncbi:hypothetical protein SS1G_13703 [Sclerotinia sclerotiorum 1980 UF-70]|uniref:DUF2428 domain-containing protein n=1 Tax=Sclerotinia sclerotiorum (strain ATCC 18683 / 1980 / Ss-1) TaxID=665079 RepID=A7F7X3_SCLS1|nr:hypothetical protein SS1G_13703 [Sclerotinia sclerotiorum 1980 UF-70]EDN98844.1 hypothetical protein SS1G_13703 [Sclerotinia sclerotiorum 1980 UF-70]
MSSTAPDSRAPTDDRLLPKWIENQPESVQSQLTRSSLEDFLEKAAQPRHASGNACIKLCHFIEQCRASSYSSLREAAYSKETCLDLFNFYLEWNEKNQHRSMRQVLDLLTSLLNSHPDKCVSKSLVTIIVERLLSVISHQASQPLVKPAFKILEHLIGKGTVIINDLAASQKQSTQKGDLPSSTLDGIVSETFQWMNLQDVSPSAGKFLVSLFKVSKELATNVKTDESVAHTRLWQRWISDGLSQNPDALENIKNYLLPPLFKLDRVGSLAFLQDLNQKGPLEMQGQNMESESLAHLSAIEVGKKAGLVEDSNVTSFLKPPKKNPGCIILHEDTIGPLLTHPSDTVRSLAFSVLVSSASSIRPFSPAALAFLQDNMAHLYADTDAKFRNDVLSNTKHMIERIKGATAYLVREIDRMIIQDRQSDRSDAQNLLQNHENFLVWFLEFLQGELVPTASYQRHITSLRAISLLLRSGIEEYSSEEQKSTSTPDATVWAHKLAVFNLESMRLILDLLMDPFEDVRGGATAILKLASPHNFRSSESQSPTDFDVLMDFISRAEDFAKRTGRADYADGVARSYQILYGLSDEKGRLVLVEGLVVGLERKVAVAQKDLGQAVLIAPIHSDFSTISYIWEEIEFSRDDSADEEFARIRKEWEVLQSRIIAGCSSIWDAVKDILCNDSPEGHIPEDVDDIESIDTKDVLSYSFRAIHESSNLIRTVVTKAKDRYYDGSLGALQCIFEQASTTRRSAGIPALVTGILSANARSPAFEDVMTELKSLARRPVALSKTDETNLPQVHAMNCVKEIFKSSTLGKRSDKHIPDCLQLAADSLTSDIWAIRNCGLLLLRSLIDCLFGTNENKASIEAGWDGRSTKLSYEKYPNLPEILLKLLNKETINTEDTNAPAIGAIESVFPSLDIIRRAGPPVILCNEIKERVSVHLGSKFWHTRELAARTMCTFMLHDRWLLDLENLLKIANLSTNYTHGVLLTVNSVLERRLAVFSSPPNVEDLITLKDKIEALDHMGKCPDVLATYVDFKNLIYQILLDASSSSSSLSKVNRENVIGNYDAYNFLLDENGQSYSKVSVDVSREKSRIGGALLHQATAREAVYISGLTEDIQALKKVLNHYCDIDVDTANPSLECVLQAWRNHSMIVLEALLDAVIVSPADLEKSGPSAYDQYSKMLNSIKQCDMDQYLLDIGEIAHFMGSETGKSGPHLAHALMRTSGTFMLFNWLKSKGDDSTQINFMARAEQWNEAGKSYNDFDTRFAAAKGLSYFFACLPGEFKWSSEVLPCLITLYDTLNDDDDEVRELGAEIVSSILGKPLIPLAACEEFAEWLRLQYPQDQMFSWNIICRITGGDEFIFHGAYAGLCSPEDQLSAAMKQDDALFVEEEQNLFIDEVREAKLWSSILSKDFKMLENNKSAEYLWQQYSYLAQWVLDALRRLNVLMEKSDGPLGWTSKPTMFASCIRILLGANALVESRHALPEGISRIIRQKEIADELDIFKDLGEKNDIHPSLLSKVRKSETSLLNRS